MISDLEVPIKTAEEHVHELLRERVVRGDLPPGRRLRLVPLADGLGVSTMPVRAALLRLSAEGLVRQLPRRGFIVAPLDLHDLEEIQAVRSGIEAFAARIGAERISEAGVQAMEMLLGQLRDAQAAGDVEAYLTCERQLHETCYRAAGRERLLSLVAEYRRRADRYVRAAFSAARGIEGSLRYQEQLVAACAAHDGGSAEHVVRDALGWTVKQLTPILMNPDSHYQESPLPDESLR